MGKSKKRILSLVLFMIMFTMTFSGIDVKAAVISSTSIDSVMTDGGIVVKSSETNTKIIEVYRHTYTTISANLTPANSTDKVTWTSSNPNIFKVEDTNGNTSAIFYGLLEGNCEVTAKTSSGKTMTFKVKVKNIEDLKAGSTLQNPQVFSAYDTIIDSLNEKKNYYRNGYTYSIEGNKLSHVADRDYFSFRILSDSVLTVSLTMPEDVEYVVEVQPYVMCMNKLYDKKLSVVTSTSKSNGNGTKTTTYKFNTKHYVNFLNEDLEVSNFVVIVKNKDGVKNVSNRSYTVSCKYDYPGNTNVENGGIWKTDAIITSTTNTSTSSGTGIDAIYAQYNFQSGLTVPKGENLNKANITKWYLTTEQVEQWKIICDFMYGEEMLSKIDEQLNSDREQLLIDAIYACASEYLKMGIFKKYNIKFDDARQYAADYLYYYLAGKNNELPDIIKSLNDDIVSNYLANDPLSFVALIEEAIENASSSAELSQLLKTLSEAIESGTITNNLSDIIIQIVKDDFIRETIHGLISNAIYTAIGSVCPILGLVLPSIVSSIGYYRKDYNVTSWKSYAKKITDNQSKTTLSNKPICTNALTAKYLRSYTSRYGDFIYETWNGTSIPRTQSYDLVGNITPLNKVYDKSSNYANYLSSITSVSNDVVKNEPLIKNVTKIYDPKEKFEFSGWSVHTQGVNNYFYTIDNPNATTGTSLTGRLDSSINAKYPAFSKQCASLNAFSGSINLSTLTSGEHYIYVKAKTMVNKIYTIGIIKIKIADTSRGNVINTIDGFSTKENEVVVVKYSRMRNSPGVVPINIKGWSLNSNGVNKYYYTVDDESKTSGVQLNGNFRSDVYNAYPDFRNVCNSLNSFTGEINVSNFSPGGHSIYIKGVDKENKHYTIAKIIVDVTNTPNKGTYVNRLDKPSNSSTVENKVATVTTVDRPYKSTEKVEVDGWSVNSQGVSSYYYTIDNESSTNTSNKLDMSYSSAVGNAKPAYDPYCKTGNRFKGSVDVSKLKPGKHYIYVKGINKEGYHYTIGKIEVNITTKSKNRLDSVNSSVVDNNYSTGSTTRGRGSTLPVILEGWSLHDDGIKYFYYTIDNANVTSGTRVYSYFKQEVADVYPEFTKYCPTINAFKDTKVNVGNLTNGAHSIYVKAVTNTGLHYIVGKITVEITEPRVGTYLNAIDEPKGSPSGTTNKVAETTVYRTYGSSVPVSISGWSLNSQGISSYYYTIDNESKTSGAALTSSYRQDVINHHKDYKFLCYDRNAYKGSVSIGNLAPGVHTIYVKAINKEGKHYTAAKVKVDIRSGGVYETHLDGLKAAAANSVVKTSAGAVVGLSNTIELKGWSVHSDGYKSFYYTVNNESATSGTSLQSYFRSDADKARPAYNQVCNTVNAFKGSYNTKNLGRGANYIYIKGITKTGKHIILAKITVNVRSPQVGHYRSYIDAPVAVGNTDGYASLSVTRNQGSNVPINVEGWSVNTQGIKRFYYTVNDSYSITGTTLSGKFRQDVYNANPDYGKACTRLNAFSGSINVSRLGIGTNYIYIKAENKEGLSYVVARIAVYITKLPSLGTYINNVDYTNGYKHAKVVENASVQVSNGLNYGYGRQYSINGWSVNSNGVSGFYAEVDGGTLLAINSYYRSDVANAYPSYNKGGVNAYSCNLDLSKLSRGTHTVRIYADNKDGYRYLVAKINVNVY